MKSALPYLALCVLAIALFLVTSPDYIGDTMRYADNVATYVNGSDTTHLWEFGHLLWRPWGYLGYQFLSPYYRQWFGDTPAQAVCRFLVQTNVVCAILALFVMSLIFTRVSRPWTAAAVAFAIAGAIGFLNYSRSGCSYVPALLFSTIAFLLLVQAVESPSRGRRYALMAGFSFAVSCGLWFPYAFSGLGMVAILYFWPSPSPDQTATQRPIQRHHLIALFLASLVISSLAMFVPGAAAKGIANFSQLAHWVRESDNGVGQSLNAMRAVTGIPRSMWGFGDEIVVIKRWMFSDPFNPAPIRTWAFSLGSKLAIFYLGVAAALWVLWKERSPVLYIFVAAALPLLLFAVLVFEPSAQERFLPLFPFAYLAFAITLDLSRRHRIAAAAVVVLLSSVLVFNLTNNKGADALNRRKETRERIQALSGAVRPDALVFVLTFNDDLYRLPAHNPLDKTLIADGFRISDVVLTASQRLGYWRGDFAEQSQKQWTAGKDVWVSERLLAQRPEPRWMWVEGDDRNISWPQLPVFFNAFEFDSKVLPGKDGFLRLARTAANHDLLAATYTRTVH